MRMRKVRASAAYATQTQAQHRLALGTFCCILCGSINLVNNLAHTHKVCMCTYVCACVCVDHKVIEGNILGILRIPNWTKNYNLIGIYVIANR